MFFMTAQICLRKLHDQSVVICFLVNIMLLLWFLSMFYRLACMVCAHERRTAGATLAPASTAAGQSACACRSFANQVARRQRVGGFFRFFKSVYIYTQIEVFRENSNQFRKLHDQGVVICFLVNIMRLLWFLSMSYRLACMVCARRRGATATPLASVPIKATAGRALSVLLLIRLVGWLAWLGAAAFIDW